MNFYKLTWKEREGETQDGSGFARYFTKEHGLLSENEMGGDPDLDPRSFWLCDHVTLLKIILV